MTALPSKTSDSPFPQVPSWVSSDRMEPARPPRSRSSSVLRRQTEETYGFWAVTPAIARTSTRSRRVLDTCAFPDVSKVADVGTLGRAAYATWDDGRFKSLCDEFGLELRKTVKDLSRGMGMKLTLAFALSHDPELLVLDEATAAMDTETERLIQDALSALIEGRTTITIAHRLSTLKDCNHLFVIENGEIAEEGTHAELLAKKGTFYRLYMLQNEANKKIIAGM